MNLAVTRNLSIKLFLNPTNSINFFDYDEVTNGIDVNDISSFLEKYSTKYKELIFEIDNANALFIKKHSFLHLLLDQIIKLSPSEFEKLSAVVCSCLGYENFYGTKVSHDQGIDFIAQSNFDKLNIDIKHCILGQCKHFENNLVGTGEIRQLAGSVILFSRKEFSTVNPKYTRFLLNTFSHIHVYFMASYFYSEESIRLCRSTDIIYLDIIDICCLCAQGIIQKKIDWIYPSGELNLTNLKNDINFVEIV